MRMVIERDAEHVAGLALVPVGPFPYGGYGGNTGVVLGHACLDSDLVPFLQREELVHDVQPLILEVDTEDGAQELEVKARSILRDRHHLWDVVAPYLDDDATYNSSEYDSDDFLDDDEEYDRSLERKGEQARRALFGALRPVLMIPVGLLGLAMVLGAVLAFGLGAIAVFKWAWGMMFG